MEILTKRLAYIDAMRGFTMILVVFSHVQYFGYGEFIQSVYNFCGGSWKVYCNECEAIKAFARFKKCTSVYVRLWNQGRSVRQLTVAA